MNLDKEKLEREMRLFFVARKLDNLKAFSESEMLQTTSKFFGPKFNQKQDLIAKEESSLSEKVVLQIIPSICWPIRLTNPLKQNQVVHPMI